MVCKKILEIKLSREQQKYDIARQKNELKLNNLLAKEYIQKNKNRIIEDETYLLQQKSLITKLQMKKADGKLTEAEEQQLQSAQQYVRENEARILQDKQKLAN